MGTFDAPLGSDCIDPLWSDNIPSKEWQIASAAVERAPGRRERHGVNIHPLIPGWGVETMPLLGGSLAGNTHLLEGNGMA